MEEVQVREDVYEYDVSEANRILQLERTEEQWTNVCEPCENDDETIYLCDFLLKNAF